MGCYAVRPYSVRYPSMKQRQQGPENLTPEILREAISELYKLGIRDSEAIQLALAQIIIINSLGGQFWAKECTTFGSKQEFFIRKSDVRAIHLAHVIWCLKGSVGFHDFLKKNDQNNFESTYYEAVAAYLFLKHSCSVELVIPSQVRGEDFDLRIQGFRDYANLNVEVKARRNTFKSEKQALDFLKRHRSQLPRDMNGAIFCKIDTGNESIDQASLEAATKRFLNDTHRVKFVVYCWDAAPAQNAIALGYCAVGLDGDIGPIFDSAIRPIVPQYIIDTDTRNGNT